MSRQTDTPEFIADRPAAVRVLHIDDNANFADLVAAILERERDDFTVITETDPHAGTRRAIEDDVDCVVCDYHMPERNGLEVLDEVKRSRPHLPFILFTGKGSEEIASEAISRGVTEYLQKDTGTEQPQLLANRIEQAVAKRRAERRMVRGFRAMDEAPVGIILTDPDRADNPITYANDGFLALTGYSREEVLGRNCRFLQGEETRDEPVAELRETIDDEVPATVELRNYRKDGECFWNRVTVAPLYDEDGSLTNYVGFQEDVTHRRELEEARRRALEQYQAFGAFVSHDLQNPLRTLRGRLELAIETGDVEQIEEALPAVDRLQRLTDDLAETMRSGAIVDEETDDVDIDELATAVWRELETGAQASFDVRDAPRVSGNAEAIERMLDNLLRNALDHGGSDIQILLCGIPDGFYLEDNGPGIDKDERERVFDPGFTTSEDRAHAGLGLPSVRQVVDAHGWQIRVTEGAELGGARFEITDVDLVDRRPSPVS